MPARNPTKKPKVNDPACRKCGARKSHKPYPGGWDCPKCDAKNPATKPDLISRAWLLRQLDRMEKGLQRQSPDWWQGYIQGHKDVLSHIRRMKGTT